MQTRVAKKVHEGRQKAFASWPLAEPVSAYAVFDGSDVEW